MRSTIGTRLLPEATPQLSPTSPWTGRDAAFGLFSATGFTDELAAQATASKGKILLATLDDLYGQPS